MPIFGDYQEEIYEIGETSTARVNDPDGNEHKITFVYMEHGWEIQ